MWAKNKACIMGCIILILAGLLVFVWSIVLDKMECDQRQEYRIHDLFHYEYHFPAGCLWVSVDEGELYFD